jgi:hypothetical protein
LEEEEEEGLDKKKGDFCFGNSNSWSSDNNSEKYRKKFDTLEFKNSSTSKIQSKTVKDSKVKINHSEYDSFAAHPIILTL